MRTIRQSQLLPAKPPVETKADSSPDLDNVHAIEIDNRGGERSGNYLDEGLGRTFVVRYSMLGMIEKGRGPRRTTPQRGVQVMKSDSADTQIVVGVVVLVIAAALIALLSLQGNSSPFGLADTDMASDDAPATTETVQPGESARPVEDVVCPDGSTASSQSERPQVLVAVAAEIGEFFIGIPTALASREIAFDIARGRFLVSRAMFGGRDIGDVCVEAGTSC